MKYSSIYLIGANGVGLSAVGKLFIHKGIKVSGSDLNGGIFFDELKKMGAAMYIGHDASQISDDVDLVLYSAAVPQDNPELIEATKRGMKLMTYAEILGEISKSYKTIAVAGTHGKSTTTAMLATILEDAGYDPTVIIGSRVPVWEYGNIRIGESKYLVVEACEYKAHFLELDPDMIVLTNIDADHLDYYKNLDHIIDTFQKFVERAGIVFVNGNDKNSTKLEIKNKIVYELDGTIDLAVPGKYNLENATAAKVAALEIGVSLEKVQASLGHFEGIWRRFERVGEWNETSVFSDYGHHPTAIRKFLEAAREYFPGRRLIHIFQPHQHSRTKDLFGDFVDSLGEADITIIPEIYVGAGRKENSEISSGDLVKEIKKKSVEVIFTKDLEETKSVLEDIAKPNDVLLFQGAGDIDDLARSLVNG